MVSRARQDEGGKIFQRRVNREGDDQPNGQTPARPDAMVVREEYRIQGHWQGRILGRKDGQWQLRRAEHTTHAGPRKRCWRESKRRKQARYRNLKARYRLAELVLLLHYRIRGLMHNAPFEGASWKNEDVVAAARANLAEDAGHFDRAFLYLAYNAGQLFLLYPRY